ncbi:MAG: hypothetical protein H0V63_08375 [Burkholderiaceae bacterium]|nr:hypothetical protein [Burkholderiaceae bacterium]
MARITHDQQERNELSELAGWMGVGQGGGMAIGHFTRYGGVLGGVIGVGAGLVGYLWGASTVFIGHFVGTTGAYNATINLDGRAGMLQAYGQGGVGGYGLGFPGYGGSGYGGFGGSGGVLPGGGLSWHMIAQY